MDCPICGGSHPVASNPAGDLDIYCKGRKIPVGSNGEYWDDTQNDFEEIVTIIDSFAEAEGMS